MGPGDGEADAVAETVEIYMIAKMKKALDLSREQEEKVVPLIQDLGEARRGFQRDRRLSMMKLRSLLEDPKSSDADLTKALNQIHDGERRFRDTEEKTHQQMRAVLTARQQAQFLIFLERFQSEMQQRVRRLRGRGQGPQGDPVGPGPMRRRGDRPR